MKTEILSTFKKNKRKKRSKNYDNMIIIIIIVKMKKKNFCDHNKLALKMEEVTVNLSDWIIIR